MSPRIRSVLALLALTALGATPVRGQVGATPLTLRDVARLALERHPAVRAARADAAQADAAAGERAAARWPAVELAGSASRFNRPMVVTPIHGFTPGLTPPFDRTLLSGRATLAYALFDGGVRGAQARQARALAGGAETVAEARAQEVLARAVSDYLEVLVRRRVLEAHDRRLAAIRDERDHVRQSVEAGRAAEVELLRADAALAEAEAERVRLSGELAVAEGELERVAGLPDGTVRGTPLRDARLRDETPPPRETLLARGREASLQVAAAQARLAGAVQGVRATSGSWWPRLDLVGSVVQRAGWEMGSETEWSAALQLSYPLFTGGARRHRIARARWLEAQAEAELAEAELAVADAVERARAAVETATAREEALRRAEAGFAEVARVERLRLETGAGTVTEFLRAEADLLSARASLARARYAGIAARAELERAVGGLDLAWLELALEDVP